MSNLLASEPELIKALQRKEEAAMTHLYANYGIALKKVISEILPENDTVNDVYQQCMVSIWQKIHMYDASKGRLFTWMLNICRNASIDMLRSKNYRNHQNQQSIDNVYEIHVGSETQKVDTIGLKKVINSLPDDLRKPLTMNYLEGYTHDEISEILGWPLGTVKTRIRNAIIQLRKKMVA
jgi:RNA polymerase sigma factor (sigma-70 family)